MLGLIVGEWIVRVPVSDPSCQLSRLKVQQLSWVESELVSSPIWCSGVWTIIKSTLIMIKTTFTLLLKFALKWASDLTFKDGSQQ